MSAEMPEDTRRKVGVKITRVLYCERDGHEFEPETVNFYAWLHCLEESQLKPLFTTQYFSNRVKQ